MASSNPYICGLPSSWVDWFRLMQVEVAKKAGYGDLRSLILRTWRGVDD